MTPSERDRVKAALRAYLERHQISVHDLVCLLAMNLADSAG
jgi:hypothetical protein